MRILFFILFGIVLCLSGKGQYFNKSYVYPNPTSGIINLTTTESIQNIEIYNLQGQIVQEVNPRERTWELPQQSGLYLFRIQMKKEIFIGRKLLKIKT